MEKLPTIYLEQKRYRKENQLLIRFTYNEKLIALVRPIKVASWSSTLSSWYVKDSEENFNTILTIFKNITEIDTFKINKKQLFKRNLTEEQKKLLNSFYLFLKGKRYSQSTIQTYTFFVADFVNFHTKTPLEALTNRHVELFIEKVFIF